MKRTVAILFALLLTLTACAASASSAAEATAGSMMVVAAAEKIPFSDVPDSAWYAEALRVVSERGIMNGTGEGEFSSDEPFTRAQVADMVYRYLLLLERFADVDAVSGATQKAENIVLTVAGKTLTVEWADNSSVDALRELLRRVGTITLDMSDYAGFEKGAPLPETLPQNNEPMNTDAGDVILYQGRQFVIYYDRNSYSLTPLGRITGMAKAELQALLGADNVTATLSLALK